MKKSNDTSTLVSKRDLENTYQSVIQYITQARENVVKAVNIEQVVAYWHVGRVIFTQEQSGENRAEYGKALLANLADKLKKEFGEGFSVTNLKYMRKFYLTYSDRISHEVRDQLKRTSFAQNLSWTHYRMLMKESRQEVRQFYEIEASKNHWSTPQLERQMTSFLYERLAASRDEDAVLALANQGHTVEKAEDILKSPYVLDFLGYKQHHTYTESDLESAIITHLQDFLLEAGRGFAFLARQKRLVIDGDVFILDLLFYHVLLKCYVIVDIKINRLTHKDIGQMQMYVNYYDRAIKQPEDNPTIGLLLCAEQNETVVKYTLPEGNQQIFARKYQLHLPTIDELQQEVEKEYQLVTKHLEKKSKSNTKLTNKPDEHDVK